jgi:hypothetical protein
MTEHLDKGKIGQVILLERKKWMHALNFFEISQGVARYSTERPHHPGRYGFCVVLRHWQFGYPWSGTEIQGDRVRQIQLLELHEIFLER